MAAVPWAETPSGAVPLADSEAPENAEARRSGWDGNVRDDHGEPTQCVYTCIYIHIYIYMYTYVYICIYMYMYIWYVYTIFMHTFNTHKQWYVFRTCSQVKLGDVWVSEAASHKQWEDIQQLSPMIAWFDYITNGDPNTKVLKEDKEGRSLTAKSFKEWLVKPSWCINVHSIHSGLWDPQTLWCLCSIVT